jgi:hypothetical protein
MFINGKVSVVKGSSKILWKDLKSFKFNSYLPDHLKSFGIIPKDTDTMIMVKFSDDKNDNLSLNGEKDDRSKIIFNEKWFPSYLPKRYFHGKDKILLGKYEFIFTEK